MSSLSDKVLVVTGSLIAQNESSLAAALGKQLRSFRSSSGAWFDIQAKLMIAEMLVAQQLHLRTLRFGRRGYRAVVERYFGEKLNYDVPDLTQVLLVTLLQQAGLDFSVAEYGDLYAHPEKRRRLLAEHGCVFASTTLLRDLSEMIPMMAMLKRPGNRLVAGGALVNMLGREWPGGPAVDALAVGYGEMLVPAIAAWIRSGYRELAPPQGGRLETRGNLAIMHSGTPAGSNLDFLPAPDWKLAERVHGRAFKMVYYESMRGCPFHCLFCNFPYLFEDSRVRSKSAERIAADWADLAAQGVEYLNTLDSLFTMPRRRLLSLCQRLIQQGTRVKWICYARATDLVDPEVCCLMREAGCIQVHVGLESGSQLILDNMQKRVTVEQNRRALLNCRAAGIATIATLIVGFPGETAQTVRESYELVREAPPDMIYVASLNTRFERAPLLEPEHAERFGLVSLRGGRSSIPYWRHDTMCCTEVGRHLRWFNRKIAEERLSLDGSLFWSGFLSYRPELRAPLLDFQYDLVTSYPWLHQLFRGLDTLVQRKLAADVKRVFGPRRSA